MSAQAVEALLARLYTDAKLRQQFRGEPERLAREHGLDEVEAEAFANIDGDDLELAAQSYERKRAQHAHRSPALSHSKGWRRWLSSRSRS